MPPTPEPFLDRAFQWLPNWGPDTWLNLAAVVILLAGLWFTLRRAKPRVTVLAELVHRHDLKLQVVNLEAPAVWVDRMEFEVRPDGGRWNQKRAISLKFALAPETEKEISVLADIKWALHQAGSQKDGAKGCVRFTLVFLAADKWHFTTRKAYEVVLGESFVFSLTPLPED